MPAIRPLSEIPEVELTPPPVLIDKLLYQGGKLLFSGPSKSRKTWMLLHLAAALASGQPWFGFETKKSNVLFLDLELMPFETPKRLKEIMDAARLDNRDGISLWNLRGHSLTFDRLKPMILDYCRQKEISLICLDPYYRLSEGADENANGEIAAFLQKLEGLAHEAGAAVALTHHFAKGNAAAKASIDRMSGAGTFARDPDCLISLTEGEGSSAEEPVFVIESTVRSFAPVDSFAVRWNFPLWLRDDTHSCGLKNAPGRPKSSAGVAELLEAFKPGAETRAKDIVRFMADEKGISKKQTFEILSEAVSTDKLHRRKDGRDCFYSLKTSIGPGVWKPF